MKIHTELIIAYCVFFMSSNLIPSESFRKIFSMCLYNTYIYLISFLQQILYTRTCK